MVSKNTAKFIRSLQIKKYRQKAQAFLVEGEKSIIELLHSGLHVRLLISAPEFIEKIQISPLHKPDEVIISSPSDISSLGSLQTNESALAVVSMPEAASPNPGPGKWGLVLDDVRNPGNLGTIIRIADWYGIDAIVCNSTCADFYNPKVISATMGSFARLIPYYTDLEVFLGAVKDTPVYGAYLEGDNIHKAGSLAPGWLVMGNESTGISEKLRPYISAPVTIPRFGSAESLNVAIATAVLCDNLLRLSN